MSAVWAGIDSGKRAHHCVLLDQEGQTLLSRRIDNDETVLLELIAEVAEIAAESGFSDQAHLSREFSGVFGWTPRLLQEYLRRIEHRGVTLY